MVYYIDIKQRHIKGVLKQLILIYILCKHFQIEM